MLVCEDCNKNENEKEIHACFCPYDEDVNDKKTEAILCNDCYHERCDEI